MSIKKTQAILECFIDLKCGVWFTLGSADETMFCDTKNYSPQIWHPDVSTWHEQNLRVPRKDHRNNAPGARFSKVPIINGPGKLSPFTLKIEVSIVLHLI